MLPENKAHQVIGDTCQFHGITATPQGGHLWKALLWATQEKSKDVCPCCLSNPAKPVSWHCAQYLVDLLSAED